MELARINEWCGAGSWKSVLGEDTGFSRPCLSVDGPALLLKIWFHNLWLKQHWFFSPRSVIHLLRVYCGYSNELRNMKEDKVGVGYRDSTFEELASE